MRRTSALLAALGLVAALAPPAQAEPTTVVIHAFEWPEEVGGLTGRVCGDPVSQWQESAPPMRIEYSTATNPIGERIHGFDGNGEVAIGPIAFVEAPSTASWTLEVEPRDGAASGYALAFYFPPGGDGQSYYFGYDQVVVGGTEWTTLDSTAEPLQWTLVDQGVPGGSEGIATLASFVNTHGGDGEGAGAYLGYVLGCDANLFFYDGLVVGPPGDATTYDFEGGLSDATMETTDRTITSGDKVTVAGLPGGGFQSVDMTLEARPFGSDEFSPVGTVASTNDGEQLPARLAVRPKTRTEYRWVIEEAPTFDGSTSDVLVVQVRRKVTMSLADVTLKKGQDVVATGKATPAGRRVAVQLQRKTSSGWKTLDKGRTKTDGTYRLSAPVSGHAVWKLRTVASASAGSAEGTSPVREATVG